MLTKIVYNCDPESLADVGRDAFTDAFENEIRANPAYRDLEVEVTFQVAKSEVTEFVSDDWEVDISREDELREQFLKLAEKAFSACLS